MDKKLNYKYVEVYYTTLLKKYFVTVYKIFVKTSMLEMLGKAFTKREFLGNSREFSF